MIRGSAPEDQPYSGTIYDPLWQGASELEMPFRCISSRAGPGARCGRWSGISRSLKRTHRGSPRLADINFTRPTFRSRSTPW
jgi:hypothetical protein